MNGSNVDRSLLFYQLMGYPVPREKEFFAYGEKPLEGLMPAGGFSWTEEQGPLEEFRSVIHHHQRLRRSLPFVESIYLCNSISFNGLKDDSDIDLFFVVKEGRMRLARWWSTVLMFVFGIKRFGKWVRKKFCLSFYVTPSHLDLQKIRLSPTDPYLVYRLAHLVPLYHERPEVAQDVYESNFRLREYLPNHPLEHIIDIGTEQYSGATAFKTRIEQLNRGLIGDVFEYLIKWLWLPILFVKRRRLGPLGETIILSDHMLKFHADQRQFVATKRKVAQK